MVHAQELGTERANASRFVPDWIPGNGKIKVFRGEQPRGSITLTDGKVSSWRAL